MTMPQFGPGTLKIGATGSELDVECLINGARIVMTKDEGDSTTKLCGTIRPGKITYTYALSGNIDVDSSDPAGLFALSQASPGSEQAFEFTPSTEGETSAAGVLVIDPLDFGADAFGDDMVSDFEFSLVGPPVYTFPTAPPPLSARLVVNGKQASAAPAAAPAAEAEPVPEPANA
jgi:hypothetical protein